MKIITNNGKTIATGSMTDLELLQERIDPFAVKTAIVEDEAREQHASSEYDLPAGFHYDDWQSVDEMEPVYDGFPAFIIDDTEKLNCTRIPHLDHIHHKSTIDNITILHQVDFPICD